MAVNKHLLRFYSKLFLLPLLTPRNQLIIFKGTSSGGDSIAILCAKMYHSI